MSHVYAGIKFGLCWWDLVLLTILVVVIALFVIHTLKVNKKIKALEDQLSDMYAMDVIDQENL